MSKTKDKTISNIQTPVGSIDKLLVTFAAGLIVILGLKYIAQDLIAPLLLAFFLAIILRPLFNFFRKKGIGSTLSIFFMIMSIVLIIFALIVLLNASINILQGSVATYISTVTADLNIAAQNLNLNQQATQAVTRSISPEAVTRLANTIISSLGSLALYILVIPILAILLVVQMDSIPASVSDEIIKENPKLKNFSKFADSIIIYVVGRFKVNLITGLLFSIALLILNVDFAFFWGFMTIFLSFIPYLGIVLAAAFPTLIALGDQGLVAGAAVVLAAIIINLFVENVLDPIIQGKGNKLSPAVVVISIIFWGWVLGAVGLILAAPLTVLLKLILSEYSETAWLARLIEGDFSTISEDKVTVTAKLKNLQKGLTGYFKA